MDDFESAARFIKAFAEIIGDAEGWKSRADEVLKGTQQSAADAAEAKRLHAEASEHRTAAAADLEKAKYERGQAEFTKRETVSVAKFIKEREDSIAAREKELMDGEAKLNSDRKQFMTEHAERSAALDTKQQVAEDVMQKARELMAQYDEAKHQAALRLAS